MEISFLVARRKLAQLWLIFGGLVIFLVFIQTLTGRYNGIEKEAWEWLLPNVLPNIALIITAQFGDRTDKKNLRIQKSYYWVSLMLSVSYLLLLTLIIISYSSAKGQILGYYKSFNLLLTGIQNLVTVSLGLFFVNKK